MAGSTDHYGLKTLSAGDGFSGEGYKYTNADRQTIDRLLYLGAEGHRHTGEESDLTDPTLAPELLSSTTGGLIPAGTRVYYRYTYLNGLGEETVASPEVYLDTPSAVSNPGAPGLTYLTTGGALTAGNYYYVLSAYVDSVNTETRAVSPSNVVVATGTITNQITLSLPSTPGGATGFNIYRRKPGQTKYFYLDSVETDVATPPATYVDDGSTEEDCDRSIPHVNGTNSTNSITVSLPGATPTVPDGYTWKLYRTYVTGGYTNSLLHHVVEYTAEATPVVVPYHVDTGLATTAGEPPDSSLVIGNPEKISLTDAYEIEGRLPMGMNAYPFLLTMSHPGLLEAPVEGTSVWVCEFPEADIVFCRAALGIGSAPASTPVIVDVNKGTNGATPTYDTIYTTQGNRPSVLVGQQIGDETTPDVVRLSRGESLSMDLDQVGGGATPTDSDLTVNIYMIVYGYPTGASYVEGSPGGVGGSF